MSRPPLQPLPSTPATRKQVGTLNRAIEQLNEDNYVAGINGVDTAQFPGGRTIDFNKQEFKSFWFYAVIVNRGPENADYQPDFTDSRYWVQSITLAQAANTAFYDVTSAYGTVGTYDSRWTVATNLTESSAETHSLHAINPLEDGQVVPIDAVIVRVWMIDAGKFSSSSTDTANTVYILEPLERDGEEFDARITAVSGSFPTWSYSVQRVKSYDSTLVGYLRYVTDGRTKTAINTCEFAPQSGYPYTYGTGNTITASDGTVNSTTCKVVAVGVGSVVRVTRRLDQSGSPVYSFFAPNSSQ